MHMNSEDSSSRFKNLFLSTYNEIENSTPLSPRILTPFNYIGWREGIQIALRNKILFRMTMGREVEPQQYVEKNKFLNRLDEAFSFMCTHISWDIFFHIEGLRTSKEAWEKLEYLFGKQDELIALQPNSFETIQ